MDERQFTVISTLKYYPNIKKPVGYSDVWDVIKNQAVFGGPFDLDYSGVLAGNVRNWLETATPGDCFESKKDKLVVFCHGKMIEINEDEK